MRDRTLGRKSTVERVRSHVTNVSKDRILSRFLSLSLLVTTSTSAISFVLGSHDQAFFNMARYMAQILPIVSSRPSLSCCDSRGDLVALTTVPGPLLHLDLDHDLFVYALDRIRTQAACALCHPPIRPPLNRCTLNFCTGCARWSSPVLTGPRPPTLVPSCQDQRFSFYETADQTDRGPDQRLVWRPVSDRTTGSLLTLLARDRMGRGVTQVIKIIKHEYEHDQPYLGITAALLMACSLHSRVKSHAIRPTELMSTSTMGRFEASSIVG
jgi:hypothetical protein